jgi:DNA-binding response OmpR family regulator
MKSRKVVTRGEKMNHKKTILLVDDDAYFRFAMATELRVAGYIVQSAHDGDRALQMLEDMAGLDIDIDIVITDLVMPRKDGFRFSTELRQNHRDIPILVISGHFTEEAESELRILGRVQFLEKPFTPGELLARVEGMISGNSECS